MFKGIYVAMSGAVLRSQELDGVANNLANLNTTGYKKTTFSSQLYPMLQDIPQKTEAVYPEARAMTYFGEYYIDKSEGNIKTTGNPLDLALKGDGFFAVESKGLTNYTRNGSFSMDRDGYLVTSDSAKVMDTGNKPVNIRAGNVTVDANGNVNANGNIVGKLKLVKLDNIQLVGGSLFSGTEAGDPRAEVVQGAIEMSNVNPVREMIGMISALRGYDTAQKVIQGFNDLSQRSVTEIGKV